MTVREWTDRTSQTDDRTLIGTPNFHANPFVGLTSRHLFYRSILPVISTLNFEFGLLTGGRACFTFFIELSLAEESQQKDTIVAVFRSDWVCSSSLYLRYFPSDEHGSTLEVFFVFIVV